MCLRVSVVAAAGGGAARISLPKPKHTPGAGRAAAGSRDAASPEVREVPSATSVLLSSSERSHTLAALTGPHAPRWGVCFWAFRLACIHYKGCGEVGCAQMHRIRSLLVRGRRSVVRLSPTESDGVSLDLPSAQLAVCAEDVSARRRGSALGSLGSFSSTWVHCD